MPTRNDQQPEQVKNHIADATEMVQPVPLKEGRDLPLGAFQWDLEARMDIRLFCRHETPYEWQGVPLSILGDYTLVEFQSQSECSEGTLARIEATMKANGVEWRGE